MADLRTRVAEATTSAMKARDKARVAALRLVNADIKRLEVDERRTASDDDVIAVLNRMLKQRAEAEAQYRGAGRVDLADQEAFEASVIREFMPQPLSDAELDALIDAAVRDNAATSMRDMGKVMAVLRGPVAGRADMADVSARVKARLGG